MNLNMFKDKLFDILNETDDLPVKDLEADDVKDTLYVTLSDDSVFKIHCSEVRK